jgi:prepilin signal peptidase PulO-like enzyme (type II secretory pathway)
VSSRAKKPGVSAAIFKSEMPGFYPNCGFRTSLIDATVVVRVSAPLTLEGSTLEPSFWIDLITALWLGFVGACIGSFLNVVAYRWPKGMSVVWKPSHCPRCNHPIRPRDNVPVLGWLMLRGKCRDCGAPISPRYAIVEAIMGLAFFGLAYLELFPGGQGVVDGEFVQLSGALQTVWNPQWKLLGLYALHGLLACCLTVVSLLWLDGNITSRRFSLAVAILSALAVVSTLVC